jgi:hypothetical protein
LIRSWLFLPSAFLMRGKPNELNQSAVAILEDHLPDEELN